VNTLLSGVAFSMMTFTVATVLLSPSIGGVLLGVSFAALIGVLGGLGPAWRAAHIPVVDALRHA
jgi:ABC-type antimicrobial peptide transport system permease subunit